MRMRTIGLLIAAISAAPVGQAWGIPAFARQEGVSSTVCHSMTPRLNGSGEAYRLNGYRVPAAGGEKANGLGSWTGANWSADLPKDLPVSFRTRTVWEWRPNKSESFNGATWEWEVFAGSALGENLSFFGHYNLIGSCSWYCGVWMLRQIRKSCAVGTAHADRAE